MRNRLSSPLARRAAFVAVAITALLLPAHAAVAATLDLSRTIQTSPFTETSVSMGDNEGSAFVPSDHSLWLADDIKKRIYEVDPATGALKRTIQRRAFSNARKLGGRGGAGKERANDFEAIAYNRRKDVLYVFSGPCCNSSMHATAFRLTRRSGRFKVESYQPLPTGADYTAAAWSPTDGKIWVGKGVEMRSFRRRVRHSGRRVQRRGCPWDPRYGLLARRRGPFRHGEQRTADPGRLVDEDSRRAGGHST